MHSSAGELLGSAVDAFTGLALDGLSVPELQHLTGALVPQLERLAGVRSRLVGELVVRSGGTVPSAPLPGDVDGAASSVPGSDVPGPNVLVQHWLRDLGRAGGSAAGREVRQAGLLRSLPLVHAAVLDGRLPMAQAIVLTRLVGVIDPAALAEAEPSLVLVAVDRDPQELARWVAHQIATWCEPQLDADERSQQAKRYLQTWRDADGMLTGRFRLTAADSELLLTVLEPLARRNVLADERDAGQRRADALVEVFGQVAAFGELPDAGGFRPQVSYVMGAAWAAGAGEGLGGGGVGTFADLVAASLAGPFGDDPSARVGLAHSCPLGAWSGPQTRSTIETILCDARLTRVLLTDRGQVKGLEALGESITATQRRALAARDLGCAVRGCTRPPSFCDAHHLDQRADGGSTDLGNLVLLCRRHHTLWHRGRLTLHQLHVPWITGTHDPPF